MSEITEIQKQCEVELMGMSAARSNLILEEAQE